MMAHAPILQLGLEALWLFYAQGLEPDSNPKPKTSVEFFSCSLVTTITWWVCRLLMDSRDLFGGHVSKKAMEYSTFRPCHFHHDCVVLILHSSCFGPWIHHSDFNSHKQLHNTQTSAIFAHFLGGKWLHHLPSSWAVTPWRDMWPMWKFLRVSELRGTTHGRQVSDSTPNHPVVMDVTFVLKPMATWGPFQETSGIFSWVSSWRFETWACSWRIRWIPLARLGEQVPRASPPSPVISLLSNYFLVGIKRGP